jgi:hypothetical protein
VERARDPLDLLIGLREGFAEMRSTMGHMQTDVSELKLDVRRLDDRVFQVVLLQLGTLAARLVAIVAAVLT